MQKKRKLFNRLCLIISFFSILIFGAKAQNITTFSLPQDGIDHAKSEISAPDYAAGEIIVKFKDGKKKELEELLKDKVLKGKILMNGILREKMSEQASAENLKNAKGYFLNAEKYKIPDLKSKVSKFFANFIKAKKEKKQGEKIAVTTIEFGEIFIDFNKNEIIDPYTMELLEILNKDENIEYAQINHSVETFSFLPTDSYYSLSWSLENTGQAYPAGKGRNYIGKEDADIDAYEGWGIDKSNGGEGIIIAVIDTGIDYTHEDFGNCSLAEINDENPATCPKFVPGYDIYNNDNNPIDDHGHGTMCAGIIGALNNNKGIAGVSYNARLMPVKGLGSDGKSTDWHLANAVIWAVDNGADILNASWGFEADSSFLEDAFKYAYDKGVISVAAAGNGFGKDANFFSPAKYNTVITVGASDSNDILANFSNTGSKIDVVAPGAAILSTRALYTGNIDYAYNEKYIVGSGTSMSAPYATGAAALILANNQDYTPENIRIKLREGADDLGESGVDNIYGAGRLNLANALKLSDNTQEKIFAEIKSPSNNEIITQSFYIIASVEGDNNLIKNWQIYYKKKEADILEKATGENCFGNSAMRIFSCRIKTDGWENQKLYDIELVVQEKNKSITAKKEIMFINIEPPINLTANGANPSPWQDNPKFIINWKYPSNYYRGIRYKLGNAPLSDKDGTATTTKPFNITATAMGGQDIYIWLENFRGDSNHKNYAKVSLNYGNSFVGVPCGIKANSEIDKVILKWEPSKDSAYSIVGYNIFKSSTEKFNDGPCNKKLVQGTSYEFDNLEAGVTYYFAAQAVDSHGNKSEISPSVEASLIPEGTLKDLINERIKERLRKLREETK
ncbi:MAG: S8 family serine peptidase [bacterium]